MSEEAVMTVPEVAEYLRITDIAVRALIRRGNLPAVKLGKSYRLRRVDVEALLMPNTASTRLNQPK